MRDVPSHHYPTTMPELPPPRRMGRRGKLSPEARALILAWQANLKALGAAEAYVQAARIEWRRQRHALGSLAAIAYQHNVSTGCVSNFINHKVAR